VGPWWEKIHLYIEIRLDCSGISLAAVIVLVIQKGCECLGPELRHFSQGRNYSHALGSPCSFLVHRSNPACSQDVVETLVPDLGTCELEQRRVGCSATTVLIWNHQLVEAVNLESVERFVDACTKNHGPQLKTKRTIAESL
jgi:hypothetical protein